MYKLVDSTFIFAIRNDIKSVDLLPGEYIDVKSSYLGV